MTKLHVPDPSSAGLLLTYNCTSECRHCMYACSPRWKPDWIPEKDAKTTLTQLAGKIQGLEGNRIGVNCGLHLTGGEPFMNFDLLLEVTRMAQELKIPSTFVETNCFWCTNDNTTRERLVELRSGGLHGILISVNPFILEQVPFERTERAARIGGEVFGGNAMIYQEFFYEQFKRLGIKEELPFEKYLQKAGPHSLRYVELLPMGRAPYKLGHLYRRYSARQFFGESCRSELTRDWHVHIDNYGNYVTGYCAGISLGDARDLDSISEMDLEEKPILDALVTGLARLWKLAVDEFSYNELPSGYVSKCHLCVDIRKHIMQQTDQFKELKPREFYSHLH